jgi:hypothetical protein
MNADRTKVDNPYLEIPVDLSRLIDRLQADRALAAVFGDGRV